MIKMIENDNTFLQVHPRCELCKPYVYRQATKVDFVDGWKKALCDRHYKALQSVKRMIEGESQLELLKKKVVEWKHQVKNDNQDYHTGYMYALSVVEGMIAGLEEGNE